MITISNNPIADAIAYEIEQEEMLKRLPMCECCGEPIQQEKAVYYNDQWICKECEYQFWLDIRDDFLSSVETL